MYATAQRSLEQQDSDLSDLRTRTNTLVAAATVSASFLGATAISRGASALVVGLAIAAFVTTGTLAGWVLWPAKVLFAFDVDKMYRNLNVGDDMPETLGLRAAYALREAYITNRAIIEQRETIFRLALIALGLETVFWVLALLLS